MRRLWLVVSIVLFVLVLVLWMSGIAVAFPENIRHGYPSCASCHVSGPAGGGALTPYGRNAAATFLSTWAAKDEENLASGLVPLPSWLAVGGDQRSVIAQTSAGRRFVPMQYDAELAVSPVPELTVAGSAGLYGPDHQLEYRRLYAKLSFADTLAVRAGRFMPAYGIGWPDHRLPTRQGLGFGEGRESYNTEASVTGELGEFVLTQVFGDSAAVNLLPEGQGYNVDTERAGVVMRGAVYLGDRVQLGASRLALSTEDAALEAYGVHLLAAANDWVYLLGEYDRAFDGTSARDVAAGKLGVEVVRGLHVSLLGERDGDELGAGAQVQWFPRPHFELLTECKRIHNANFGVLLFHHYL